MLRCCLTAFTAPALVLTWLTGTSAQDVAPPTAVGVVTFDDGIPLTSGKIGFHLEKGKSITAKITDGTFQAKGLPLAQVFLTIEGDGVPKIYGDVKTTPLRCTVQKGQNRLNIKVKKE